MSILSSFDRQRSRRARRGYTVVEVMSAMTLFAIGAAGVIGMQRVTIQGGADARNFDTATNIAREWQHRLQRDSLAWTTPDSTNLASNIDDTLWLDTANITDPPTWRAPIPHPDGILPGYSAAFDLLGRDVLPADPDRIFCVQYRLGWVAPQGAPGTPNPTAILRAEVRVFWSRLEFGTPTCGDLTVADTGNADRYHFVYVTTALRGNPITP
jgi:prepilin-type N-terminal cleavage/methylation domain-containing protein